MHRILSIFIAESENEADFTLLTNRCSQLYNSATDEQQRPRIFTATARMAIVQLESSGLRWLIHNPDEILGITPSNGVIFFQQRIGDTPFSVELSALTHPPEDRLSGFLGFTARIGAGCDIATRFESLLQAVSPKITEDAIENPLQKMGLLAVEVPDIDAVKIYTHSRNMFLAALVENEYQVPEVVIKNSGYFWASSAPGEREEVYCFIPTPISGETPGMTTVRSLHEFLHVVSVSLRNLFPEIYKDGGLLQIDRTSPVAKLGSPAQMMIDLSLRRALLGRELIDRATDVGHYAFDLDEVSGLDDLEKRQIRNIAGRLEQADPALRLLYLDCPNSLVAEELALVIAAQAKRDIRVVSIDAADFDEARDDEVETLLAEKINLEALGEDEEVIMLFLDPDGEMSKLEHYKNVAASVRYLVDKLAAKSPRSVVMLAPQRQLFVAGQAEVMSISTDKSRLGVGDVAVEDEATALRHVEDWIIELIREHPDVAEVLFPVSPEEVTDLNLAYISAYIYENRMTLQEVRVALNAMVQAKQDPDNPDLLTGIIQPVGTYDVLECFKAVVDARAAADWLEWLDISVAIRFQGWYTEENGSGCQETRDGY
jgi:hypothetical protein